MDRRLPAGENGAVPRYNEGLLTLAYSSQDVPSPKFDSHAPLLSSQREAARPMLDLAGKPLAAAESLGLYVAACRETFEEAGLLLAMDAKGFGEKKATEDK